MVARLRVASGFVLVLAFAWFSQPDKRSLGHRVAGVAQPDCCCAPGPRDISRKTCRWRESGPYAYVRNPLYLGTLLVAAGLVIATRRWLLAALFAAVFVLIYLPVIELEQQHLSKLFPEFRRLFAARPVVVADASADEVRKPAFNGSCICGTRSIKRCWVFWREKRS